MKHWEDLTKRGQIRRLRDIGLRALKQYPVRPRRVRHIFHGENTTFRVDGARESWLLRVHRPTYNLPPDIRSELLWLEALQESLPGRVPEPMRTSDQDLIVETEASGAGGKRTCTLLRWVHGRVLPQAATPTRFLQVGELAARLHEQAAGWKPPKGFTRRQYTWESYLLSTDYPELQPDDIWVALPASQRRVFQEATRFCRTFLDETVRRFPSCLIHHDLHQGNTVFADGKACAIDFDDTGFGTLAEDFAAMFSTVADRPDWPQLRDAFFSGYAEVRALPKDQIQAIPGCLVARITGVSAWAICRAKDNPGFAANLKKWMKQLTSRCLLYLKMAMG